MKVTTSSRSYSMLTVVAIASVTLISFPQLASAQKEAAKTSTNGGTAGTDMERLRAQNRLLNEQLQEFRSQMDSVARYLETAPEIQTADYAKARSEFRTKLVREDPPPQSTGSFPSAPDGVREVAFASGPLTLRAWINPPTVQSKRPAVIFLHGGFSFGLGDWEQARPYRDAGFITLVPALRGENGQPGAWSSFYNEVDDVLAAAEYLIKQPYIDAGNVFLAGHSVGGTLSLLSSMASSRFRAVAAFDGLPVFTERRAALVPFDSSDPREARMRSVAAFPGSFKCPARIYSATSRVGSGRQQLPLAWLRTAYLAKQQGLDVEAIEVEGDHTSHVQAAMRQSIQFFRRIYGRDMDDWTALPAPLPTALDVELGPGMLLKTVRIEPGSFRMGSPDDEAGRGTDETIRTVTIQAPFTMGIFEVTQAQYRQVMGVSPSLFAPKRGGLGAERVVGVDTSNFPVEYVTWEAAMDFCRAVSLMPGVVEKGWLVDLPTEAEWEYAARAGASTTFPWGNTISSTQANINGDKPYGGAPVGPFLGRPTTAGSYAPNAWGLYDMIGNVNEWTKDWYVPNYSDGANEERRARSIRGGGWAADGSASRTAQRGSLEPSRGALHTGFRVVVRQRTK